MSTVDRFLFGSDPTLMPPVEVAELGRVLHQLDEAHRRFRAHIAETLALTARELSVLVIITDTPGISPYDLARDLETSPLETEQLLERLVDAGHVTLTHPATLTDAPRVDLTTVAHGVFDHVRDTYRAELSAATTDKPIPSGVVPGVHRVAAALNLGVKKSPEPY